MSSGLSTWFGGSPKSVESLKSKVPASLGAKCRPVTWDRPITCPHSGLGVRTWGQRGMQENSPGWAVSTSQFWGTAGSPVRYPVLMSVGERRVIRCSVGASGFSRGQLCGVVLAATLLQRSSPPAVESVTDPGSCQDSSFMLNSARIIFCGLQL